MRQQEGRVRYRITQERGAVRYRTEKWGEDNRTKGNGEVMSREVQNNKLRGLVRYRKEG